MSKSKLQVVVGMERMDGPITSERVNSDLLRVATRVAEAHGLTFAQAVELVEAHW